MRAVWNGAVVAESSDTVVVEGNHYFPVESVDCAYLVESESRTVCSWKGTASYWSIKVGERLNPDAAWFYPDPKDGAEQVAGRVAFWRGVVVEP